VLRRRQLRRGEKGGAAVGKTKRGKRTKWMVVVDGAGTPLGAHLDSASPHEVTLLERTLATIAVPRAHTPGRPRQRPERLIADRAYDSNPLRARLARRGIEPIIPALANHPNATHQDGRKAAPLPPPLDRRAHLLVARDLPPAGGALLLTYAGFFHLACAMLVLRRVMK
jgi:hypothetical protein